MPQGRELPPELARLLNARDSAARERAWNGFLETYSRLILHTLRRLGGEYDALMDAYTYVLEHLRRDEYRRLRAYTPSAQSQFSTWLVVVVHRLGVDQRRHRYGYFKPSIAGDPSAEDSHVARRRLVDLLAEPLEQSELSAAEADDPDASLRKREFQAAVEAALDELSPRDRLLLKLRFERDMSARRIAELMNFPTPFHVYRRCNHLCRQLRAKLAERGVDDAQP